MRTTLISLASVVALAAAFITTQSLSVGAQPRRPAARGAKKADKNEDSKEKSNKADKDKQGDRADKADKSNKADKSATKTPGEESDRKGGVLGAEEASSGSTGPKVLDVKQQGDGGVKTYKFGPVEVEGRLKSPQIVYFLRRVRAEFAAGALGHRSFMRELSDTRRNPALK